MAYARKIILHTPLSEPDKLEAFVEACLTDGVTIIATIGPKAAEVEDSVDWLVVGDADDADRFVLTTAHPGESVATVREFLENWDGELQEVWL